MKNMTGWKISAVIAAVVCLIPPAGLARQNTAEAVDFSFDRVELPILVRLVSDLTGRSFVIGDDVTATITFVSPARVPAEQVYPLFLSIIEASGYTVLHHDGVEEIVPLVPSTVPPAPLRDPPAEGARGGMVTRVLELQYIDAVEVKNSLEPLVRGAKEGGLAVFGPSNHLIVTDTEKNVARIESIIARLDRAGVGRTIRLIPLEHADAAEVAESLNRAMAGAVSAGERASRHLRSLQSGQGSVPADMLILPAVDANSLIAVGDPAGLARLEEVVGLIDRRSEDARGPLHAIFLKYMDAEECASSINALLERTTGDGRGRNVGLEPSKGSNALLVHASPSDYRWVRELVETLDVVPEQVLVEILIAEVTVGSNVDIGVEWSTIDQPAESRATVIGATRPGQRDRTADLAGGELSQGLTIGMAKGLIVGADGSVAPSIPFLLRALSVHDEVNILASVPLWAQNNREAKVSVVDNIPLLSSTIEGGAGTARDVIQNIERADVGITLAVTPHVNPRNEIMLELHPSIESVVSEGDEDKPFTPTISRREVKTTVTIPNRATIVISGLIREDRFVVDSKVPLLGDIPLLGVLFRQRSTRRQRTNLLIFVTPHIVTDMAEAALIREELENRAADSITGEL